MLLCFLTGPVEDCGFPTDIIGLYLCLQGMLDAGVFARWQLYCLLDQEEWRNCINAKAVELAPAVNPIKN